MQIARRAWACQAVLGAALLGLSAWGAAGAALAAGASTSIQLEVRGTVRGQPEAIEFKGPVRIESRTVRDAEFGAAPSVELSIDMSRVVGLGSSTRSRYVTQTREVINTPLHYDASRDIAIDFLYESAPSKGEAVSGIAHATFRLFFVPPSGDLSNGRGWIDAPASVGVVQR